MLPVRLIFRVLYTSTRASGIHAGGVGDILKVHTNTKKIDIGVESDLCAQ